MDLSSVKSVDVVTLVRIANPGTTFNASSVTTFTVFGNMMGGMKVTGTFLGDPNPHVGFGGPGPHFCLGTHLARREITVMFRELFRRLPDLRITSEPDRLRSGFINGVKNLQVHVAA